MPPGTAGLLTSVQTPLPVVSMMPFICVPAMISLGLVGLVATLLICEMSRLPFRSVQVLVPGVYCHKPPSPPKYSWLLLLFETIACCPVSGP